MLRYATLTVTDSMEHCASIAARPARGLSAINSTLGVRRASQIDNEFGNAMGGRDRL